MTLQSSFSQGLCARPSGHHCERSVAIYEPAFDLFVAKPTFALVLFLLKVFFT
jgi:hypothetical protein